MWSMGQYTSTDWSIEPVLKKSLKPVLLHRGEGRPSYLCAPFLYTGLVQRTFLGGSLSLKHGIDLTLDIQIPPEKVSQMCLLGSESINLLQEIHVPGMLGMLKPPVKNTNVYYTYRRSVHSLLFCQNDHQETTKFGELLLHPSKTHMRPENQSFGTFPFSSWVIFSSMQPFPEMLSAWVV